MPGLHLVCWKQSVAARGHPCRPRTGGFPGPQVAGKNPAKESLPVIDPVKLLSVTTPKLKRHLLSVRVARASLKQLDRRLNLARQLPIESRQARVCWHSFCRDHVDKESYRHRTERVDPLEEILDPMPPLVDFPVMIPGLRLAPSRGNHSLHSTRLEFPEQPLRVERLVPDQGPKRKDHQKIRQSREVVRLAGTDPRVSCRWPKVR